MGNACQEITLPDLIVNACPLGCNQDCSKKWTNKTIRHRIVCNCQCHRKKRIALAWVEEPLANAESPFQEVTKND
jgi:hypothetical protein